LLEQKQRFSKKPTFVHFPLPTGLFYEKSAISVNEFQTIPIKANTFGLVCLAEKPTNLQKHKQRNPDFLRKIIQWPRRWTSPTEILMFLAKPVPEK
jgi:hypothetical protein